MFSCSTMSELDEVLSCFFILTNSMFASDLVAEKFAILKGWKLKIDSPLEAESFNEIDETYLSGMFYPSKLEDLEQETKSPFLSYYQDKLEKLLVSDTFQNPFSENNLPKNLYYSKDFCTKVLKFIVAKICNTSKLMLGDLSRHKRSCTSSQKSLYVKYSERCKKLAKSSF